MDLEICHVEGWNYSLGQWNYFLIFDRTILIKSDVIKIFSTGASNFHKIFTATWTQITSFDPINVTSHQTKIHSNKLDHKWSLRLTYRIFYQKSTEIWLKFDRYLNKSRPKSNRYLTKIRPTIWSIPFGFKMSVAELNCHQKDFSSLFESILSSGLNWRISHN